MAEKFIVTGKVRISYPHVFQPYAQSSDAEPSYSVVGLLPKSDITTKQALDTGIAAAFQEGIAGPWNGAQPPNISVTLYDGDGVKPTSGEPWGDECRGHWILRTKSARPPQVLDAMCEPIANQNEIYGGCYARLLVHFYPYAVKGNRGIGCGLDGVQKLENGEPFGESVDAKDYFTPQAKPAFGVPTAQPPMMPQGYPQQPAAAYGYPAPAPTGQPYPPIHPVTGLPM